MLNKGGLNEKEPEYGMATIRAVAFALDTGPMFIFHLLEGLIRLGNQIYVRRKYVFVIQIAPLA